MEAGEMAGEEDPRNALALRFEAEFRPWEHVLDQVGSLLLNVPMPRHRPCLYDVTMY